MARRAAPQTATLHDEADKDATAAYVVGDPCSCAPVLFG